MNIVHFIGKICSDAKWEKYKTQFGGKKSTKSNNTKALKCIKSLFNDKKQLNLSIKY